MFGPQVGFKALGTPSAQLPQCHLSRTKEAKMAHWLFLEKGHAKMLVYLSFLLCVAYVPTVCSSCCSAAIAFVEEIV